MRNKILNILLDKNNSFLSGEIISQSLGITRAAVWKHIKSLRQEGFKIESKSKIGYRLIGIPETLESATLLEAIETQTMGKEIEVYDVINSTNNRAKQLALEGAPEGTLVVSEAQSEGRGRLGRSWISHEGKGIWMSLILRPNIPPERAPEITAVAAISIRKALHKITGRRIGIKWPNDIILEKKKVCGILTEIYADMDMIHYVVVGIGINANQEIGDFSPDIRDKAISLKIAMGHKVDRRAIIAQVMMVMEDNYFRYINDKDFSGVLEPYKKYSVTLNRQVRIIEKDSIFEGYALDFDTDGSLLVLRDNNQITKVMSGDVSVRGDNGYV